MKWKLKILLILAAALLITPIASAAPSVTINEPENKNYTHTTGIPLDVSLLNEDTCWWTIDEGINNNSIGCHDNKFSVDYNDDYNFTFYVADAAAIEASDSVFITVNNEFGEAKAYLLSTFLTVIIGIGFLLLLCAKISTDSNIHSYFFFFGLVFILAGIWFFEMMLAEYIKLPSLDSTVILFGFIFLFGIIVISLFYYIFNIMGAIILQKKKKRGILGDDEK